MGDNFGDENNPLSANLPASQTDPPPICRHTLSHGIALWHLSLRSASSTITACTRVSSTRYLLPLDRVNAFSAAEGGDGPTGGPFAWCMLVVLLAKRLRASAPIRTLEMILDACVA